ncbi:hypothetical protein [Nostoc sp. DedQUE07]|uniref:hypothetical protein n=1 Tax=Nostoc sp. DedQUE07 TaxID=3075392 RepID=UPI00391AA837
MPEYTLVIKIPFAGNREFLYGTILNGSHESYPEDYFRVKENRQNLSRAIETESSRKISTSQLDRIVSLWILDIKQGYRRTTVALDMPTDTAKIPSSVTSATANSVSSHLVDLQQIPSTEQQSTTQTTYKSKPPNINKSPTTASNQDPVIGFPPKQNSTPAKNELTQPANDTNSQENVEESKSQTITSETWVSDNRADF